MIKKTQRIHHALQEFVDDLYLHSSAHALSWLLIGGVACETLLRVDLAGAGAASSLWAWGTGLQTHAAAPPTRGRMYCRYSSVAIIIAMQRGETALLAKMFLSAAFVVVCIAVAGCIEDVKSPILFSKFVCALCITVEA